MADLLSYRGDAGLGLGSNPGISAFPKNPDLNQINEASKNIMLLNNQWNLEKYRQKIKDRDTFNQLALEGQVPRGEILPEYQPVFDAARDKLEKYYYENGDQLLNDPKKYREYGKLVQDLKDVTAHAQTNTRTIKTLQSEKAKEALPYQQKRYDDHIQKQKQKGFWDVIDPYQKLHDVNFDTFQKFVVPQKTSHVDMKDPFGSYDQSFIDYADVLRNSREKYLEGQEEAEDIRGLLTQFQNYEPQQLTATLSAMDNQIKKYNKDRGLTGADAVQPVSRGTIDGVPVIKDSAVDFAAKYALTNEAMFNVKTPKFNKEIADYGLKKDNAALALKKFGLDQAKAGAYIRHMGAMDKKMADAVKEEGGASTVIRQYNDFIDNIKPQYLVDKMNNNKRVDAIFMDQLPEGYQFNAGPVVNSKGKLVSGKLEPLVTARGRPYYMPKYVNPKTGQEIKPGNLPEGIQSAYNRAKARADENKIQLTEGEFLQKLLKKNALELILRGKNGASNYTSMSQSARLMNAQATTKGEENVMDTEEPPFSTYNQDEE